MSAGREAVDALASVPAEWAEKVLAELSPEARLALARDWPAWAHVGQRPEGDAWRVWVMLAGRGFGKTRAGAEWVMEMARAHRGARVALVAGSIGEARALMIEGPSGLLAVAREEERAAMDWVPSRKTLTLPGGGEAVLFSGARGDGLRGPEHHFAWCDELAKWTQAESAWGNLTLGLRLGARPRALVTTTPRALPLLRRILEDAETARSGGRTGDNPHLPARFVRTMERQLGGTRLGRQELDGALLDDLEGALLTRAVLAAARVAVAPPCARVVVGVDPPASDAGTCGIVVAGLAADGCGYVLADASVAGATPEGWAKAVRAAVEAWGAARVVAEGNMGGRMVESVLRGAGVRAALSLVHAVETKAGRAAPVAALIEGGRVRLAGRFDALEDQLAGFTAGEWRGEGPSPDRADACVWALTELMLRPLTPPPRARML